MLGVKHRNVLRLDIFQPVNDGALQFLHIFLFKAGGGFDRFGGHAVLLFGEVKINGDCKADLVKYNAQPTQVSSR